MLTAIVLILFAAWCIVGIFRPGVAVSLALLQFSIEQTLQAYIPYLRVGNGSIVTNAIIAVVATLAALRLIVRDRTAIVGWANGSMNFALLFFAWSLVTLLWTPSSNDAISNLTWGLPYLFVFQILCPFLVRTIRELNEVWVSTLIGGLIFILMIILSPEFDVRRGRLTFVLAGTAESTPLALGELGGLVMLVAALLRGSYASIRWQTVLLVSRASGFVFGTLVAIQSGSRGQFFAAAALAFAFYPVAAPIRSITAFAGTVVGLIITGVTLFILFNVFLGGGGFAAKRFEINELLYGTSSATGRFDNVVVLLSAWIRAPQCWIVGLGYNAFTAVSPTSEPYSHVLFADAIFEMGIVGAVLLGLCVYFGVRASIRLIGSTSNKQLDRTGAALLFAVITFEIIIANKQGALWQVPMCLPMLAISGRLWSRYLRGLDDSDEVSEVEPLD